MRRLGLFLLVTLSLAGSATAGHDLSPPNETGNTGEPPGEAESIEGAPGVSYGLFVLVGMLAFAGALAYVALRQRRQFRRR